MRISIRWLFWLLCLAGCHSGYAQTDSVQAKKVTYYNTFMSGVLIGCGTCNSGKDFTYSALTLHGLRVSPGVSVAVGLGMDVYSDWRLFPVVGSITFESKRKKNSVYVQVNAGHAWGRYLLSNPDWWGQERSAEGGFTINPMLGYRIGNEKIRIYIQAGYKHQLAYTWDTYSGGMSETFRSYRLNRFVMQLGFGFN
jgi:hypothetical protein